MTDDTNTEAHWRTFIESDVIRFVDIPPGDHVVQIKEVKKGKVTGAGGKSNGKAMIYLVGKDKPIAAGAAKAQGTTAEAVLAARTKTIPAGRLGDPQEFGQLCAYLASAQAGYITGQNFLIDGGTFPGAF